MVIAAATRKSSFTADTKACRITWLTISALHRVSHCDIEPPTACREKYPRWHMMYLKTGEDSETALAYAALWKTTCRVRRVPKSATPKLPPTCRMH